MRVNRPSRAPATIAVTIAAVILLGLGVTAMSASATAPGSMFDSSVIGRPVGANVSLRGVPAGAVPWTIAVGRSQVSQSGQLNVVVKGLLITGTNSSLDGTVGPVHDVVATLTCEGGPAVSTANVPLSTTGDANIEDQLPLPATCLAPIVLVRANSASGPWIAATGL